jgi:hypothetical protein
VLEDAAKSTTLAKALVAGAREGRMIRDTVFQAQLAEPAIGQVDLNLAAIWLRPDRKYVADDEHLDYEDRINRGAAELVPIFRTR